MIEKLLSPEVQKFIKDHQNDDPFLLSLNTKKSIDFPLKEAIEQIESRKKAKGKLRGWSEKEGLIFAPPISVEQSSSETTAKFKASLIGRQASLIHGKSIVDLTGGMGVDTSFFADCFESVCYVDPNERLYELAKHNFKILDREIKVYQSTAEDFLHKNQAYFDVVFIDPSRRVEDKRVFRIEDCSPNLYKIIPKCKTSSGQIFIKLSPLVDLSLLIKDFEPTDIWIVAVKGEVKEVLCLISKEKKPAKIHAVDLLSDEKIVDFSFIWEEEAKATSEFSLPMHYIYEPNAAMLKSGAFKLIGKKYNLKKLHQHTHLYTSNEIVKDFPGKILKVQVSLHQNKKEIHKTIQNKKINVITRNYPLSSEQLKKKFGLKDGGDQFLIGATLMDGKKVLLRCERIN